MNTTKESLVTPEVAKVLRHKCRYCAARFKTPEEKSIQSEYIELDNDKKVLLSHLACHYLSDQ